MTRFKVFVPVTRHMSPYQTMAHESPMETVQENALWHYNRARDHDGLPPLKQLPVGTRFEPAPEH